jgi:sulfoxide reductase catalytic subunit YedY
MSMRTRHGWELPESLATPESVYVNRRTLIGGGVALAGAAALGGFLLNRSDPTAAAARSAASDPSRGLYPVARNQRYTAGRPITAEGINITTNNFYEFGAGTDIHAAAQGLITRPWILRVDGQVEQPLTLDIDTLLRRVDLEERVYRHRAMEGWSMVVPWSGFPLKALVDIARPLGSAKYLRMESFLDPAMAGGQKQAWYPWPYVEALTLGEATHELAFLVTGAYGKPVAKSMGAPLRVHLPWKYGFKSIKSIVRFSFVEERPLTFWPQLNARAYGFWANVNPAAPNPTRSQASERDIGTGEQIATQPFNGYGEFVAGLYAGLEGEALYI